MPKTLRCGCCDKNTTRKQMIKKHGTLDEFMRSVGGACTNLWITPDQARDGIKEYKEALQKAKGIEVDNETEEV